MIRQLIRVFLAALTLLIAACGTGKAETRPETQTPVFATPTVSLTPTFGPTDTSPPPTLVPTVTPIEALTTTQVNIRAGPSTTSSVLGMILLPSRVEVIGKDASGTWYQLVYADAPEGRGWVLAAYVQIVGEAVVPVVAVGSDPGAVASVLVTQQVHVRSGPGTQHESLGILTPNDVVALAGKDPNGAWLQVEFAGAPDGKGWVNTEFVQASGIESVPVVGVPEQAAVTQTADGSGDETLPVAAAAAQDMDSAGAPSISVTFSPAGVGALQYSGEVSAPEGDIEDWIEFKAYQPQVVIHVSCMGSKTLQIEVWQRGVVMPDNNIICEERHKVVVQSNENYLVRLRAVSENDLALTQYILKIEQLTQ